jgi:hypothetical protein
MLRAPSYWIRQRGTKVSVEFSPSISRVESAALQLDQRASCHVANCITFKHDDKFSLRDKVERGWIRCWRSWKTALGVHSPWTYAQRSSGNWLLTVRSSEPQGHNDLAPQDLFLKSGFRMGCARIWLTSHTKQETKQDGVTLTSFWKASGSNLSRGTNYPHWGPCFHQFFQMFGTIFLVWLIIIPWKKLYLFSKSLTHFFLKLLPLQYNS